MYISNLSFWSNHKTAREYHRQYNVWIDWVRLYWVIGWRLISLCRRDWWFTVGLGASRILSFRCTCRCPLLYFCSSFSITYRWRWIIFSNFQNQNYFTRHIYKWEHWRWFVNKIHFLKVKHCIFAVELYIICSENDK